MRSCIRSGAALLTLWLAAVSGVAVPDVHAQETGRVQGLVTASGTGRPLVGAQVFVPGTEIGTLTNSAGRYLLLDVPAGDATIRIEMLGYAATERAVVVTAGALATADFVLEEQAVALDALVVTATGEQRKREIGNSLATISAGELAPVVQNPQDIIAGRATGVTVLANSGQPGAGGTIRLRGNNSISQGNNPIIYVDGVRIFNGNTPTNVYARQATLPLNDINPADIERIEIIKGPAATTLYGTEASGGVIQIFTKRGRTGQASWQAEITGGFHNMGHVGPESDETGLFVNQCRGPGMVAGDGVVIEDPTCPEDGSWLRNGPIQRYSLSVRGGGADLSYYLSGNYGDEQGVLPTGGSKNGGFRGNFAFRPVDGFEVSLSSSYSRRDTRWVPDGNNGSGFLLNVSRGPDSNFKGGDCTNPEAVCVNNGDLLTSDSHTKTDHFITGLTLSYTPNDRLSNKLSIGYDHNDATITTVNPFGYPRTPTGQMYWERWTRKLITVDYVGSLHHEFGGSFASTFSWGGQVFDSRRAATEIEAEDFSGPGEPTLTTAARRTVTGDERLRVVNAGFFFQEMVGWNDRLFVTAGLRVDGNSAFGESFGLQPYPKLSASYILSDHAFWPSSWWQTMKLRAAVGESGKAPGAFDAVKTWQPIAGEDGQPAFTPEQLGNPDLGPERTREVEVGFETSAFEGRLGVNFTYYNQNTYDALVPVTYPPSNGFTDRQLENVGHLRNTGIELGVDLGLVRNEDVEWRAGVNLTTIHSEAVDLNGESLTIEALSRTYVREGYPVPGYFGKKIMNPDAFADPVIEEDQYLGSAYPTRIIAPSTSLTLWNRITLDVLGEFQQGGHLLNALAYQNANRGTWQPCYDVQDAMRAFEDGDASALDGVTALERARCSQDRAVRDYDFWIEATDFFKLRSVALTFDLPSGFLPRMRSASLTLAGQNLFTSTDYSGTDPEVADFRDSSFARRDYYNFPTPRTFTASLRLGF